MSGALTNLFGFGPSCDIRIALDGENDRLRTRFRAANMSPTPTSSSSTNTADAGTSSSSSSLSSSPPAAATASSSGRFADGMLIYSNGEEIKGEVVLLPKNTSKNGMEHLGINVQLLGQVELFFDKGNYYDIFKRASIFIYHYY